jgi:hypothetical protein
MNMQNIQTLFLLVDTIIKLAPWRIVTETMQRIGYGASEGLARSLGAITAEFTMLPQGNATSVNWVMHGPAPFISKVMQVFMNIDKMIGRDFEAGLANLKRLIET